MVVELLSPGTEAEDLGQRSRQPDQPPGKWQVYQDILRVPYYFLFDRYDNQFRAFVLNKGVYEPQTIENQKFWVPALNLGLGVWQGHYQGIHRSWLRWYDTNEQWVPTPQEAFERERQQAQQERQRAEQEQQQAENKIRVIAQKLIQANLDIAQIAEITGLPVEDVQQLED